MTKTAAVRCGALALGVLGLAACQDLYCGYGGPGCGTPGVRACRGPFAPGQTVTALATFHDDTGAHPAAITSFSTSTPQVLSLASGPSKGRLLVSTLATGTGRLSLAVAGWEGQTFTYLLEVTSEGGGSADAGTGLDIRDVLPDGGSCPAEPLTVVR